MENKKLFWTNNFKTLYSNGNYLKFIPTATMSRYEQLNAITRFCIYLIIVCLVFNVDTVWYQIPIIIILIIILLVHIDIIKNNVQPVTTDSSPQMPVIFKENTIIDNPLDNEDLLDTTNPLNNVSVRSGSDSYSNSPSFLSTPLDPKPKKCKMPTDDNPFMNPEVYDALEDDPPVACNSDDVDIDVLNKQVTNKFNDELFRDATDLFEIKNSQRQFYTIAGSKTPDTVGFANWLYGNMPACQSNQMDCFKYNDLTRNPAVFL